MKILCLAPPSRKPNRITGFTFIDEELHALSAAGVEVYTLSDRAERDTRVGKVQVFALPPSSIEEVRRTLVFVLRRRRDLAGALSASRELFWTARVERFAADLIRRHGIDVIHSHFGWPSGFGGLLASADTGTPLVAMFRGMDILIDPSIDYGLRRNSRYDRAVRMLLRRADATVYNSEFMRQQGIGLGAKPEPAVVIRKGVDTKRFRSVPDPAVTAQELGFEPPMILAVSALIPRKGIDDILRALGTLRDTHAFSFVVCGEGKELENLQELARQLGIAERTHFVGRIGRDEIPKYFAGCRMFVHAAVVEAAGNVVLEAMSAGRPVVCMDSGGPPEYVREGETGFVVPVADTASLAHRIRLLLDRDDLCETLGRNGRREAVEHLRYEQMIDRFRRVYEHAVQQHGDFASTRPSRDAAVADAGVIIPTLNEGGPLRPPSP